MSPLSAYTRTKVATASAPQIMVSLFQAALSNMRASAGAFEHGDDSLGSLMAEKAATIVLGLQGTLNEEVAPDLCAQLKDLYVFVAYRLGMAGSKFSAQHVYEAERVFSPIAEAFVEAAAKVQSAGAAAR
jgi:flagellar biosynthetic protein FliS